MKNKQINVLPYMENLINSKLEAGKSGTANMYKATFNHLNTYCGNRPLFIQRINAEFVCNFRDYLQSLHLNVNSVIHYMSTFRAIYNRIASDEHLKMKENPFLHLKLALVSVHKRSVSIDVIKDLTHLDLEDTPHLKFARDMFLFSFMACGMSFVDLVYLKKSHIIHDTIIYRRIKSHTEIRVVITPGMQSLIDKYRVQDSIYLFPILSKGDSYKQYRLALRTHNRRLHDIAQLLSYPINLTSYVARHTWAMEAKLSEVPISVIGEALGHTSEKTTLFYLKHLDLSILQRANKKIIAPIDKWAAIYGKKV